MGVSGLVWLVGLAGRDARRSAPCIDAWDRRLLLALAQVGLDARLGAPASGAIARGPAPWAVYLALLVAATFSAIDSPTRSAMTPRLVGAELIPSAQALNQVVWNAAGPVRSGDRRRRDRRFGLRVAYAIDVCSLVLMFAAALRSARSAGGRRQNATGWGAIVEGFRSSRRAG